MRIQSTSPTAAKAQENCVTFDSFRELNPVWALVVNKNKDDFVDDENYEECDQGIDSGGMPIAQ